MYNSPPRKILLNPGPVTTTQTVKNALIVPDISHREEEFGHLIQEVRKGLTDIVHADEQYSSVLFGSSGTGALEAVITSAIPYGKKILVVNNGSYGERIINVAKIYHIEYVELYSEFNQLPDLNQIETHLQNDPDIHAVAVVHHETSWGLLNPVEFIGTLTRRYSRLLIVDAISSYAGIPINMQTSSIDLLLGTANKCLQGMPGVSFVIGTKEALQACSSIKRSFYFDLYSQYMALEKEHLFSFTAPVQIVYALKQAIIEYFDESETARYARYKENFMALTKGLMDLDFTFPVAEKNRSYLLLLACYTKPFDFKKVHDQLYQEGYTIYPGKLALPNAMCVACIGDLNLDDIKKFLSHLEAIL